MLLLFVFFSVLSIDTPSFHNRNYNINHTYNQDINLLDYSHSFRSSEYFQCTITINEVRFTNNNAFGSTISSASGGALYASHSQIAAVAHRSTFSSFESNYASIGGAVCFIACKAFFNYIKFTENNALKFAGAFYFQGITEYSGIISSEQFLLLDSCYFENNTAHDVGGALCFSNAANSEIDDSIFSNNTAAIGGGAIYSIQTDLLIFRSYFSTNIVNDRQRNLNFRYVINNVSPSATGSSRFSARGGGAILFTAIESERPLILETKLCCFSNNMAMTGDTFNPTDANVGDNVLLDGHVSYFSNKDSMNINKIARNSRKLSIFYNYDRDSPNSACMYDDSELRLHTPHNYASNSNTEDYKSTYFVPSPTKFITHPAQYTKHHHITTIFKSLILVSRIRPNPPPTISTPSPPTPERTPAPIITPGKGQRGIQTVTKIETYTSTTTTKINTIVISYDPENRPIYTTTEITGEFTIVTVVVIESNVYLAIEETPTSPKNNTTYIIIGVVAGIILLLAAALLIWFIAVKKRKDDEDSNSIEMVEETVTIAPTTSNTVTNDNPLWTTSIAGENDDPFRKDFEEEGVEGFFEVNDAKELE